MVGELDFLKGPTIAGACCNSTAGHLFGNQHHIYPSNLTASEVPQETVDHILWFTFASFFSCSVFGARFEPRRFFFPLWLGVYGLLLLYANLK